ncbi:hypothetical protein LMG33818_001487 [Halomonadaceae bacterium LMG 33818]|uniref:hypothetical protein n=1 Tax=Cernens ardua TaxID=3402176 RepID=UPI003EDBF3F7
MLKTIFKKILNAITRNNKKTKEIINTQYLEKNINDQQRTSKVSSVSIINNANQPIITFNELDVFPSAPYNNILANGSSDILKSLTHLTSDVAKAGLSIPGKTVEVVFKPEIQKGLEDGTYKLVSGSLRGGTYADAADRSGKIVGKGQIYKSGRLKSVSAGLFQIVSIAVAQSHLEDINRNLEDIKNLIAQIEQKLENQEKSEIEGDIGYITEVVKRMSTLQPSTLSGEIKYQIEHINTKMYKYNSSINNDLKTLTSTINKLENKDRFGSGDSKDAIIDIVSRLDPILTRRELLLKLSFIVSCVSIYVDPINETFSSFNLNKENWNNLFAVFIESTNQKSNKLIQSKFNSDKTLNDRKTLINSIVTLKLHHAYDIQRTYDDLIEKNKTKLNALKNSSGDIRIALSYNNSGAIEKGAVI